MSQRKTGQEISERRRLDATPLVGDKPYWASLLVTTLQSSILSGVTLRIFLESEAQILGWAGVHFGLELEVIRIGLTSASYKKAHTNYL